MDSISYPRYFAPLLAGILAVAGCGDRSSNRADEGAESPTVDALDGGVTDGSNDTVSGDAQEWSCIPGASGQWTVSLPASQIPALGRTAVLYGPDQKVHVIFPRDGGGVFHAVRDEKNVWAIDTVDDTGDVGATLSATMDESGKIHAAYYDRIVNGEQYEGDLKVAHRDPGGDWAVETVDQTGNTGLYSSIAATKGVLHLAYLRSGTVHDRLLYGRWTQGTGWAFEEVADADDTGDGGNSTALVVDPDGQIHVFYYLDPARTAGGDALYGQLLHASRDERSTWAFDTVDPEPSTGLYVSAAADDSGGLFAAYYDLDDGGLRLARRPAGQTWTVEEIEPEGGGHTSIAIASGRLHILDLVYGWRSPRYHFGPLAGPLQSERIESESESGWFGSIAVGSHGEIYASYIDFRNAELRFAQRCP